MLGIPVIVSSALPWGDIGTAKAGLVVEPNLESAKKAIIAACILSGDEYKEFCRNAIKFSSIKFHWSTIGSLLIETYSSTVFTRD